MCQLPKPIKTKMKAYEDALKRAAFAGSMHPTDAAEARLDEHEKREAFLASILKHLTAG